MIIKPIIKNKNKIKLLIKVSVGFRIKPIIFPISVTSEDKIFKYFY